MPLGIVGLYARLRLAEPGGRAAAPARAPTTVTQVWAAHRSVIVRGFVLVGVLAATFNLWFVFLPAHLVAIGAHDLPVALACSGCGLATVAVSAPLFGRLSDRVGRRPVLTAGTGILAVLVLPLFATATEGSRVALLAANVVVGAAVGMLVVSGHLSESFPSEVRATGIALSYGLATALLGGTAPLLGSLMAQRGADVGIPAYLAVLSAVGLAVSLRVPQPDRSPRVLGMPSAEGPG